ncbi:MAG: STAS domain-containing protein [Deltaproteobacteria bacterium]|nr:STAS domain-containing protein [Deltaproteobacteria bacterium]
MIEIQQLSNVLVMRVSGELSLTNVRQFDTALNMALKEEIGRVVLDLSSLAHIDYKLVPHIVDRMIEIECLGGKLKLAGSNPYVSNILKLMGLEEEFYTSVEDAVISFSPISEDELQ